MNDLGRFVRVYRDQALRITQEELARRARLSLSTIQEIEDPKIVRRRNASTMELLAQGLNLPVERLEEAARGKVDIEGIAGPQFSDNTDQSASGFVRVELIDRDPKLFEPRHVMIPEAVIPGDAALFAVRVRDDTNSPLLTNGDLIVVVEDGELYEGRLHWIESKRSRPPISSVRRVRLQRGDIELIPANPAFERSFVRRDEIDRFGRVIYMARAVE